MSKIPASDGSKGTATLLAILPPRAFPPASQGVLSNRRALAPLRLAQPRRGICACARPQPPVSSHPRPLRAPFPLLLSRPEPHANMEPEDLPWPGELEEGEEEEEAAVEEEKKEETTVEKATALEEPLSSPETVTEDEVEEAGRELDSDSNFEFQAPASTDSEDTEDREDEESNAWLQASPGVLSAPPPMPPPRFSFARGERTCAQVSGREGGGLRGPVK